MQKVVLWAIELHSFRDIPSGHCNDPSKGSTLLSEDRVHLRKHEGETNASDIRSTDTQLRSLVVYVHSMTQDYIAIFGTH